MSKLKEKKVTTFLIGMMLGIVIAGTSAYAAIIYQSSQVSYSNSTSGLSSTNVQGAIDELSTKCSSSGGCYNSASLVYEFYNNVLPDDEIAANFKIDSTGSFLAWIDGVCFKRENENITCFKRNNYSVEKTHVQQVFSGYECDLDDPNVYVSCKDGKIECMATSSGFVSCSKLNTGANNAYCSVQASGMTTCA